GAARGAVEPARKRPEQNPTQAAGPRNFRNQDHLGRCSMKKLIDGLLDFQRHSRPAYRETFARLANGQSPDCFFVSCSDSRVVPNVFASTHPGELFVARNVGNMVPPSDAHGVSI